MQSLERALREMLGQGVGIGIEDPGAPPHGLFAVEEAAMTRARPERRAEFAGGRRAARLAMIDLGVTPAVIPHGADRAPVWPKNLVGSISHTKDVCISAVSFRQNLLTLGIDIEAATPLPEDLHQVICAPTELEWLRELPSDSRALKAKLIFCAKEAVYKALYPLTKTVIGYQAVSLRIDGTGGFEVDLETDLLDFRHCSCKIRNADGLFVATVACRNRHHETAITF